MSMIKRLLGGGNSTLYRLVKGLKYWYNDNVRSLDRRKFGKIDETAYIAPPLKLSNPANVFLEEHTALRNASIFSNNARFVMKRYAGAAEGLRVSTGNHAMIVGRFYRTIKENEKPEGLDRDVIVEEDAWLGRNVCLLPGVTVGRGAVVGAGAVCRASIPPYAIVVGNPAKVMGFKFTIEEILAHEQMLYNAEERIPRENLEENYRKYIGKGEKTEAGSMLDAEQTIDEFVEQLADVLDLTDASELTAETQFRDLDEWDSITGLSVIAFINETYDKQIGESDLRGAQTIEELYNLTRKN